jgi:hypothetical protein
MWNVEAVNDADSKRGLVPAHRPIDRNPPTKWPLTMPSI